MLRMTVLCFTVNDVIFSGVVTGAKARLSGVYRVQAENQAIFTKVCRC